MDGFTVASLESSTTAIVQKAASAAAELNALTQTITSGSFRVQRLGQLSSGLQQLSDEADDLLSALGASSVISPRLQGALSRVLRRCEALMASLDKQVMRLQPDNVRSVNWTVVTVLTDFVGAHATLFGPFAEMLAIAQQADQDASLDSPGAQDCIEHVDHAAHSVSKLGGDILDTDESTQASEASATHHDETAMPGASKEEAPPPYEDPNPPTTSAAAAPSAEPSSSFSFANSFKALMSSMKSKPGPFVSALCSAAERGDVQQMNAFLRQGASVDGRNEKGQTALQCAILARSEDAARFLLASGADWSSGTCSRLPPLFFAASVGSVETARVFVERGAGTGDKSVSGQPYFCDVVAKGNLAGVRFLLESGADANAQAITGEPVIAQAVRDGNVEMTSLLIDFGAGVDSSDITGGSLLALAVHRKSFEMAELLLKRGASPNSKTLHGTTVMADCMHRKRLPIARLLLAHGADGSAKAITGMPTIMTLLQSSGIDASEKAELARLLLESGAPPNAKDLTGSYTALTYTLDKGYYEVVDELLRHGASPDAMMHSGETALCFALRRGLRDQVALLLQSGADPNLADKLKGVPMTLAVARQDFDSARQLRSCGAVVDKATRASVRDLSQALDRPDLLELLK